MPWNYRIVKKNVYLGKCSDAKVQFGIHETYYNENDIPTAITTDYMAPYGETLEELKSDLEHMLAALEKPILYWEDFKNKDKSECKSISPQYLDNVPKR